MEFASSSSPVIKLYEELDLAPTSELSRETISRATPPDTENLEYAEP